MAVEQPSEDRRTLVRDYMTVEVATLASTVSVQEAIDTLLSTTHHGMPVVDDSGRLLGFVTGKHLLRHRGHHGLLLEVLEKGPIVASPDMRLNDAARVLFRHGFRTVPVVDDAGVLVGVLSTMDVLRSHIERTSPRKLQMVRKLLEDTYKMRLNVSRAEVPIGRLRPTQKRIHADELHGRSYELENGMAEPIIVVRKRAYYVLVDGHHRVIAARNLGMEAIAAYVLEFDRDVLLGMEKNAQRQGLHSLEDIEVIEDAQHPLQEVTQRLLPRKDEGR